MAWTAPRTWSATVVTVADLNTHVRDNELILKTPLADDGTVLGEMKGYGERVQTVSISAGNVAVNLLNGNHVKVSLNANITSFTITNFKATGIVSPVVFYFTNDGTLRTITWTVNTKTVKFSNGAAPTMTGTNAKRDRILIYTDDGDTSWFGEVAGMNS